MSLTKEIRKLLLLIINYLLNHSLVLRLLGKINRKARWIKNIFIAYPATPEYAKAYAYERLYPKMKWTPWLASLLTYHRSSGIMMVISGTEEDFQDSRNVSHLKLMVKRVETIAHLLSVSQITYAGILPGILYKNHIRKSFLEADITISAILLSEKQIQKQFGYSSDVPLIVIGSRGFLGARLTDLLGNRPVYPVDSPSENIANTQAWPSHLHHMQAVVINLSRKFVLSRYTHLFWPELIIINDVYPEPSSVEIEQISTIGCSFFHITGIKGRAYPEFPGAYQGALPCCSTCHESSLPVIVKQLC